MRKISSNSKQEMPSTSSPQYRGILNVPRPGLDFQAQTHPHAVNANSSSRYASGTPNRRGRARRQRLARILDAKDKKLTILKAELTKISNDNQRVRAETCRAQAEIERLSRSNVELKEAIRAKDYLHATAMAQERERASIVSTASFSFSRETMLQQLLEGQIRDRDELSRTLEALKREYRDASDEHLADMESVRRQLTSEYEGKLCDVRTELADSREKLEAVLVDYAGQGLQHRAILESRDTNISHLRQELCAITERHLSSLGTSNSVRPQVDTEMEASNTIAVPRESLESLHTVIQEYETILHHLHETARKVEETLDVGRYWLSSPRTAH
ncbi:hypothetical protein V5O48_018494 [Marasmius crinis-equi]|uniref:Uncharacterized protein n=1 Tax=Marasmius crinis-equi TaxID=585013 RepID=A0ABR3EL11_9AGAR